MQSNPIPVGSIRDFGTLTGRVVIEPLALLSDQKPAMRHIIECVFQGRGCGLRGPQLGFCRFLSTPIRT